MTQGVEDSAFNNSSSPRVFKTSTKNQRSQQKTMQSLLLTMSQSLRTKGLGFFLAVRRTGINSVELQYVHKNAVELIKIFLPSLPLVSPSLGLFASCTYMYTQMNASTGTFNLNLNFHSVKFCN